ncbi:hypothetical protein [Bacillus cereus]
MNLLEQHIKDVISEKYFEADWTKELGIDFVIVEIKTDCYGSIQTKKRIFEEEKWKKYKEQGYFME